MSTREQLIYNDMVAADNRKTEELRAEAVAKRKALKETMTKELMAKGMAKRDAIEEADKTAKKHIHLPPAIITEPFETIDFFPTKEDVKLAKAGLKKYPMFSVDHGALSQAFRRIATRDAVSAKYLEMVRNFEKDRNDLGGPLLPLED